MTQIESVAAPFDFGALVRSHADAIDYAPGDIIIEQGAAGDCMFILLDGEVEVIVDDRAVAVLGPGNLFGEMSLINDEVRSATVRARTPVRAVAITRRRFVFLTEQTPYFALRVMQLLSDRLRRMNAVI